MTHNGHSPRQYAALMVGWLRGRLAFLTQPGALPLVLLLLAMATVFLFGNDRGHFYRDGHHDWITSQHLAQAVNLSPGHNFLPFVNRTLTAGGEPSYITYSSWPVGSYALVKLAILPFGDDFAARLYAARILLLLLFAGSAVLSYLAMARLTRDSWVALTATLLAFASYYCLYYNDSYAPDAIPGFFGFVLAFHGMVLFVQEGRFRQLLVKSGIALLLCWQVYALLLPFILIGLAIELFKARAGGSTPPSLSGGPAARPRRRRGRAAGSTDPSLAGQIKHYGGTLLFSRYVMLGVVALCIGLAALSLNVANEYLAYDGRVPVTELGPLYSASKRLGLNDAFVAMHADSLEWWAFLENQFYRIGRMMLPFFISPYDGEYIYDHWGGVQPGDFLGVIVGILALVASCIGLVFARIDHKMLLATLLLAGFCWALPLRIFTAFHDFQALFYIGIPLTAFSLLMLYVRKSSGPQLVSVFAVAALLVFVLSSAAMANVGHSAGEAATDDAITQDFAAIHRIADGARVVIPNAYIDQEFGGAPVGLSYFLTGSLIGYEAGDVVPNANPFIVPMNREHADFILMPQYEPGPALLTPGNRLVFLYDRALYDGQ